MTTEPATPTDTGESSKRASVGGKPARRQHRSRAAGRGRAGGRRGRADVRRPRQRQPYILALLAVLATVGVFALFALASGILRLAGKDGGNPLIKAVVDGAFDGILVTDAGGRVIYANAAYLELVDAADANDVRPVERVFIGDPDVSEAVYRLLKAAREGRRLQEEVRVAGPRRRAGALAAHARAPARRRQARSALTVWTVADVTRDRERQENVFQELQHAIDYLDHAPAGFFSVDANGDIVYLNATLANWLDHDLAQVGSGGLKLADIVSGEGAALLTTLAGGARRGADRGVRPRPEDPRRPHGSGAALPQGGLRRRRRARRVAHAGAQPRARRRHRSAARRRSALHALLPQHADGDRDGRPGRHGSRAPTRCSRACSRACSKARAPSERSILPVVAERDRAGARGGDPQGGATGRATSRRSMPRSRRRRALRRVLRRGGRGRRARRRGGDRLCARDHRAARAGKPVRPVAEDADGRPARRRHRARLQQRAVRHHDGDGFPAQRAPADRSVVPGHHADQAERQPRRRAWCGNCSPSRAGRRCARRCSISARRCPTSPCCCAG